MRDLIATRHLSFADTPDYVDGTSNENNAQS